MRCCVLILLGILYTNNSFSFQKDTDTAFLKIGELCPHFEIEGINDYTFAHATPENFRGKWWFIDFWDKGCMTCIESFPTINTWQKKYKIQIQYLLIGREDENNGPQKIYEKFKRRLQLDIPNAFNSSLFKTMKINESPRIIVIRPDGIVYGTSTHITEENILDLIAGKSPVLKDFYHEEEMAAKNNPDETDNNEDSNLLFKSTLSKWKPSMKEVRSTRILVENGRFKTLMSNVVQLYMLAYLGQDGIGRNDSLYGRMLNSPIIEITGKKKVANKLNDNYYTYSVTAPPGKQNKNGIMEIMQNDLKNYFGYDASIASRLVPCWSLKANKEAKTKLKTKGAPKAHSGRIDTGLVFINYPIKDIVNKFYYLDLPVIDDTGIKGNIDLRLNYLLTNITDIRKGLQENGLSLHKGTKKMKVLIIKDAIHK